MSPRLIKTQKKAEKNPAPQIFYVKESSTHQTEPPKYNTGETLDVSTQFNTLDIIVPPDPIKTRIIINTKESGVQTEMKEMEESGAQTEIKEMKESGNQTKIMERVDYPPSPLACA
jgi:ribosomal protein S4E